MTEASNKTNIHDRLLEACKSMHNPTLDAVGQVGGNRRYKYASLASILKAVRSPLLEQGLILTQGVSFKEALQAAGGGFWVLETGVIAADGSRLTLDVRLFYNDTNAQKVGSFETYMRRYALCSAFGLVGEEDDDGAATTEPKVANDDAREAGQALGDAINIYCVATGSDPASVRRHIREKLAQTGEAGNPAALKREAANLHQAVRAMNAGRQ